MGYRDCPCVRCDHKAEGKEKEDKNTVYSTTRGRLHRKKLMQEKSGRKW